MGTYECASRIDQRYVLQIYEVNRVERDAHTAELQIKSPIIPQPTVTRVSKQSIQVQTIRKYTYPLGLFHSQIF